MENKNAILYINKESLDFEFISNYRDLNQYVSKCFKNIKGKKSFCGLGSNSGHILSYNKMVKIFGTRCAQTVRNF